MTRLTLLACLALCACAGGPDPVRLASDRANLALATRCADGWFRALPFVADDERLVRAALADWQRRIESDERLAAGPVTR